MRSRIASIVAIAFSILMIMSLFGGYQSDASHNTYGFSPYSTKAVNVTSSNIIFTGNVQKDFAGHLVGSNTNKSLWTSENNISKLYVSFNQTYLFLGVNETITENSLMIFMQDPSEPSVGTTNFSGLNVWSRDISFTSPVQYFAAVYFNKTNSQWSGEAVYSITSSANSTSPQAVAISNYYVFGPSNNSTEIRITWASMFPKGFDANLTLDISAFVVGDSGSWVGTGIPYNQTGKYNDGNGQSTFLVNNTIPLNFGHLKVSPSQIPINLAIVFNDHQPLYKVVGSNFYVEPWTEAHATQEYIEQALIAHMYPGINITYQMSGSLLYQLVNISTDPIYNGTYIADAFIPWSELNTSQNASLLYNITLDYFSIPDFVFSLNEPASNLYAQLHDKWEAGQALTEQEFEDVKVLWFLYDISTPLIEGQLGASWINSTIWAMHNQTVFNQTDLIELIHYSKWLTGKVIPAFRADIMGNVSGSNNVELMTSPFYHPLMPLLLANNISGPDGTISKTDFYSSLVAQLKYGRGQFASLFGEWPEGVWSPESANSYHVVEALNQSGYKWTQGAEWTLQQSGVDALAYGQVGSNVSNMEALYTPYQVLGPNNTSIDMVFRDGYLSNAWAFDYGDMPTWTAVNTFINYLKSIYYEIPASHHNDTLVTVALDGENWMFMSPFVEDGVPFLEDLYSALEQNSSFIHTVTPEQYLATHKDLPVIKHLAVGTWNRGNGVSAPYQSNPSLTQWSGYPIQDFYWESLNTVYNDVLAYQKEYNLTELDNYTLIEQNLSANTREGNLTRAWNAVYDAEGSDWYYTMAPWTISGPQSNAIPFDYLFKGDLKYALRQIGEPVPEYLVAHPVPAYPVTSMGNPDVAHTPGIDGFTENAVSTQTGTAFSVSSNDGWSGSIVYTNNSSVSGPLGISQVDVAYNPSELYVQILVNGNATSYIDSSTQRISLYFSEPDMSVASLGNLTFDVPGANFGTYYGNSLLGFPAVYMVKLAPFTFSSDGAGSYSVFSSTSVGVWSYQVSDTDTVAYINQTIQLAIPLSYLQYVPGDSFSMGVFASNLTHVFSSITPMNILIPSSLGKYTNISSIHNTVPPNGPGNYTYPDQPTQIPNGSLDLQYINVSISSFEMRWNFTFAQMWNIWDGPNGFSNQIISIYITEQNSSGNKYLGSGPNAYLSVPWQYMVYISGWGGYVQSYTGTQYTSGVVLSADLATRTISMAFPLSIIGSDAMHYEYTIIAGSYDGYGVNGWRIVDPVNTTNGGWQGGGGDPPLSSNIYTYIAPATVGEGNITQQEALKYGPGITPTLTPIYLPLFPNITIVSTPVNYTNYLSPAITLGNGLYYESYVSNVSGENMVYVSSSSNLISWSSPIAVSGTGNATASSLIYTNGTLFLIYSAGTVVYEDTLNTVSGTVSQIATLNIGPLRVISLTVTGGTIYSVATAYNNSVYGMSLPEKAGGTATYSLVSHGNYSSISSFAGNLYMVVANSTGIDFMNVTTSFSISHSFFTPIGNFTGYASIYVSPFGNAWVIYSVSVQSLSSLYAMNLTVQTGNSFGYPIKLVSDSFSNIMPTAFIRDYGSFSGLMITWVSVGSSGKSVYVMNSSIAWDNTLPVSHHVPPPPSSIILYAVIAAIVVIAVLAGLFLVYYRKGKSEGRKEEKKPEENNPQEDGPNKGAQ